MADPRFFRAAGPFTVEEIAARTGAEIGGAGNAARAIDDVAPLETAGPSHLTFLANTRYTDAFAETKAGAAFAHPNVVAHAPAGLTLLITTKPYLAFARAANLFYPQRNAASGIAPTAFVDPSAKIGENVSIGHHAVVEADAEIGDFSEIGANSTIGAGVKIGASCRIAANVTVSHCLMGDRVMLYPGARIGQDGFGFAPDPSGFVKIPQLGRVIIGDDVEIGANSTVDRGAGPDTVIGAGSMIDNLVQIAHNVVIGRNCVIAAQAGISGSTKLGDFVTLGGRVALAGHLSIGSGARIAGASGVMRDVAPGTTVGGIPAVPIVQWHRQTTILGRLANRKEK